MLKTISQKGKKKVHKGGKNPGGFCWQEVAQIAGYPNQSGSK